MRTDSWKEVRVAPAGQARLSQRLELITAIVTERGITRSPPRQAFVSLLGHL
jgi:hypothetical protein